MKQKEYKPTRQEKSREEMGAYSTMILISTITLCVTIYAIFELWKH